MNETNLTNLTVLTTGNEKCFGNYLCDYLPRLYHQ